MKRDLTEIQRGYSMVHVDSIRKAIEEDGIEYVYISGMATTPTPDRIGDVVEPLGAKFAEMIPLLLFHTSSLPVGNTFLGKPTKKGIPFKARLPLIKEAGKLKERVDEAIHSVKYKLITAVSIGFRVINDAVEELENWALRFMEYEIVELSLVPIPMQAEATIDTVKGLVHAGTMVLPDREVVTRALKQSDAVASAQSTQRSKETRMKTVADQIATFEAKAAALETSMEAIMEKAAEDEDRVLTADEQEEYDGDTKALEQVRGHLARLKALEKAQAAKSVPAAGSTTDEASRTRSGHRIFGGDQPKLDKGIGFARYARCLMLARGNRQDAFEFAKAGFPNDARLHNVLKANVVAASTGNSTYAGFLVDYQNLVNDFIEYLRPSTLLGKFGLAGVPDLHRVPFNVRLLRQTAGGDGYWVGEGKPKPLTSFAGDAVTLTWAKVANIAVITEELLRFSNPSADTWVRTQLTRALASRMNIDFIDPDKAASAGVSPASILNGVSPIASSGTDGDAARADIQALVESFVTNNQSVANAVLIMDEVTALTLSMMLNPLGQPLFAGMTRVGGNILGIPVITSQYVPTDSNGHIIAMVDADSLLVADDGGFTVDASREASLQMLDNPTNDVTTPTATSVVSMFQTDSIAIRAERYINWAKARSTAAAYVSGVNYSAS